MSKKQKRSKQKGWLINPRQIQGWLDKATEQLARADYTGMIHTCQRILRYVPPDSQERVDALHHLGLAYSMMQEFEQAYDLLEVKKSITFLKE